MRRWCQIKPIECPKKCDGHKCVLRDIKKDKKNEFTVYNRK